MRREIYRFRLYRDSLLLHQLWRLWQTAAMNLERPEWRYLSRGLAFMVVILLGDKLVLKLLKWRRDSAHLAVDDRLIVKLHSAGVVSR